MKESQWTLKDYVGSQVVGWNARVPEEKTGVGPGSNL